MNIESAIKEFKKYTNKYLNYGDMIMLKINHTFRVVDLCEKIARSNGLNEEEIIIAKLIGLLHDIGRFEQWKNYNTFRDLESIDHGDFGVDILNKNNYLRKYIKDDRYDQIILDSIKYHNKYKLPNNLDKRTKIFSSIIRDADKLDILYLYVIKEIYIDLDDSSFTNSTFDKLVIHEPINRKDIKTNTDRLSVSLGFTYDLYYKESLKYLKEKDYLNKIIDIYKEKTNNKKLKEQLEIIREELKKYIEVKIC